MRVGIMIGKTAGRPKAKKNPEPQKRFRVKNFSAATYSPTQLPVQYHRR